MEERNYKLYVHISPSNKRYYGITCQKNVQDRWGNNGYKYKEQHFYNAIKKYGWDNFKHEIIFSNLTKEEACLLEQCYIALYDTMNPKHGYNMTSGGEHYIASEEARRKNSEAHKGVNLSVETRQKMSASGKGRIFSDEHKKKIGESNKIGQNRPDVKRRKSERTKGEKNPMYGRTGAQNAKSKAVVMMDFSGNVMQEFESIRLANKFLNRDCSINNISRACIRKYGVAYNFFWLFKEDYINMINNNNFNEWVTQNYKRCVDKKYYRTQHKKPKYKTVYQLDKNTLQIINRFNSIYEASLNTDIVQQGIRRNCNHKCNTAGGYSWIWQWEYDKLTMAELQQLYIPKYKLIDKSCYTIQYKRKVKCIELNLIFDCVGDANEYLGKPRTRDNIGACVRGNQETAFGYHWEYVTEEQEQVI